MAEMLRGAFHKAITKSLSDKIKLNDKEGKTMTEGKIKRMKTSMESNENT